MFIRACFGQMGGQGKCINILPLGSIVHIIHDPKMEKGKEGSRKGKKKSDGLQRSGK